MAVVNGCGGSGVGCLVFVGLRTLRRSGADKEGCVVAGADGDGLFGAQDALRAVFDLVGAGLVLVGGDGVIRLANAEAERMFGYPPGALIGLTVDSLGARRGSLATCWAACRVYG